jgi:hypothetical protein
LGQNILDETKIKRACSVLGKVGSHKRLFCIFNYAKAGFEIPSDLPPGAPEAMRDQIERTRAEMASEMVAALTSLSEVELASVVLREWDGFDHLLEYELELLALLDNYRREVGQYCDDPNVVLPDNLTIYRGTCEKEWDGGEDDNAWGLSWTLNRETAVRFATKFPRHKSDSPVLLTTTVPKSQPYAFIFERGEEEVLVDGFRLYDVRRIELPEES